MYATGRGSMKVRARWKIEELARGQWQAVVTELPPGTSSQKVLEEIEELTNPKIRMGKKALSPEQLAMKQTILGSLDTIRDESGRAAPVRLVFEPKSKNQDQGEFMLMLLAHTSLESSNSINLVMIGGDGRPRQKGLSDIIAGVDRVPLRHGAPPHRVQDGARSTTASTSSKAAKRSCSTSTR